MPLLKNPFNPYKGSSLSILIAWIIILTVTGCKNCRNTRQGESEVEVIKISVVKNKLQNNEKEVDLIVEHQGGQENQISNLNEYSLQLNLRAEGGANPGASTLAYGIYDAAGNSQPTNITVGKCRPSLTHFVCNRQGCYAKPIKNKIYFET